MATSAHRRRHSAELEDLTLPVVEPNGVILLKLYAGGAQDAWDILQMLAAARDRTGLIADVDASASPLRPRSRALWERLKSG